MAEPLTLAIGRTAATAALFDGRVADPGLPLDLPALPAISRAFAPMVRDLRYMASEMAIATFLMAKADGVPLLLLPCVLSSRFQEGALLCRRDAPIARPEDLAGRRIGVRAYSQTTGMWLRGILAEGHGLAPEAMRWTTFEDAHLAAFRDPPWAERAAPVATLEGMLREGSLDAAIFGAELPAEPRFRPVFPDAAAAGAAFQARHGFVPVNHLLVMRADVAAARPAAIPALLELLRASGVEVTSRAALAPALALATKFCVEQGLIPRPLTLDNIWQGTPASIG
jgi:4,5-dihydroxyphthalate decarboxylase